MTTLEAIEKLDLLLDKYGSPYFTQAEKINFLNIAQNEFLNRLFPDSLGGVINFDADSNTLQSIRNLIYTTPGISSDASGYVTVSAIATQLQALSGDPTCSVFRVIQVHEGTPTTPTVQFKPINTVYKHRENSFKTFSTTKRYYTVASTSSGGVGFSGFRFFPSDVYSYVFIAVKTPRIMQAGTSPDFDDYAMNQIINIAAQMASVGLRDGELLQQIQNSNIAK